MFKRYSWRALSVLPPHACRYLFNRAAEKAFSYSLYFIVFKNQDAKIQIFSKIFFKIFRISKKSVFLQRYPLRSLSNQTLGFCFLRQGHIWDFWGVRWGALFCCDEAMKAMRRWDDERICRAVALRQPYGGRNLRGHIISVFGTAVPKRPQFPFCFRRGGRRPGSNIKHQNSFWKNDHHQRYRKQRPLPLIALACNQCTIPFCRKWEALNRKGGYYRQGRRWLVRTGLQNGISVSLGLALAGVQRVR